MTGIEQRQLAKIDARMIDCREAAGIDRWQPAKIDARKTDCREMSGIDRWQPTNIDARRNDNREVSGIDIQARMIIDVEENKVADGVDYGLEVPVVGLPDSPRTQYMTDNFGGDTPGTGSVVIITQEDKGEAKANWIGAIGNYFFQRSASQQPYEYFLHEVLKGKGKI